MLNLMKPKYYLVNGFLPCVCNCHENCLKLDLINRGYVIKSMKEISEKEFEKYYKKLSKKYDVSLNIKYFN